MTDSPFEKVSLEYLIPLTTICIIPKHRAQVLLSAVLTGCNSLSLILYTFSRQQGWPDRTREKPAADQQKWPKKEQGKTA